MRKIHLAPVVNDLFFILGCGVIFLADFALLRFMLFFRNRDLAVTVPLQEIGRAFEVGLKFDLIVTSFTLIPIALMILMPWGLGRRRWALAWLGLAAVVHNFLGVLELDFYNQFHSRLNSLVFQYLKEDPKTVISMLYHGFPVFRYLAIFAALTAITFLGFLLVDRMTRVEGRHGLGRIHPVARIGAACILAVVLVIGARGTVRQGPPLRWGDAFHSRHLFANHLALNGTYTLVKAVTNSSLRKSRRFWMEALEREEALSVTRKMLFTDHDEPLMGQGPVARHTSPPGGLTDGRIENVVLIIMESFSAEFVGALGHDYGITPEFDRLSAKGVLFRNFFSNGTHTHQGMFATVTSFPNLPGFEYLMQQSEGSHAFSGLPALLARRSYQDVYVYNGDFAWDNQEGFFRNQGMTRFIGRDDFVEPSVMDPTWGVADQDMFARAVQELDAMCGKGRPFMAVLQTLSNHTPYPLPERLPIRPVVGFGELNRHLTAMRYSDWALGRFFQEVEKLPCHEKTLYVVVGDHGFGLNRQLSSMDLLRFHVPLLLIAPGLRKRVGGVVDTVGSQVDVVPTIMGILGEPYDHQCWGRDLLALPREDPGFCVIKPSGSEDKVALIRGETLVVVSPDEGTEFGSFSLYPAPVFTPMEPLGKTMSAHLEGLDDDDGQLAKLKVEGGLGVEELERWLHAYVETAMLALVENETGLPEPVSAQEDKGVQGPEIKTRKGGQ